MSIRNSLSFGFEIPDTGVQFCNAPELIPLVAKAVKAVNTPQAAILGGCGEESDRQNMRERGGRRRKMLNGNSVLPSNENLRLGYSYSGR